MSNVVVVSSAMGSSIDNVWPAPKSFKSYLFTNNPALVDVASSKGWEVKFVNFQLSDDVVLSSMQSKYVKFVQFLEDYSGDFSLVDQLICVDHKGCLEDAHIKSLLELKESPILIRKTPRLKESIWHEFRVAMKQERYRRFRRETLDYIGKMLDKGFVEAMRICATGLILYDLNHPRSLRLATEVYEGVNLVGTPECQIVWAMVSQDYQDIIQTIEFNAVPIPWSSP